jgi:tripartite-type tricarboxylate transporter receptor subunit TctC
MKRFGTPLLLAACATSGFGQAFPTRPITLIVPYAAGGPRWQ